MIVYHGSTEKITHPDICHSKKYLDFGRGFYLTSYKQQAEKWAVRKALRSNKNAVINVYELLDMNPYNVLTFDSENEDWLNFVCNCRNGSTIYTNYDIIIGAVADDNVFKTVDMYIRGIWDKNRVLSELKYYKSNNQICIVNQNVINEVLIFKNAYTIHE